jgi:hypothetical protein
MGIEEDGLGVEEEASAEGGEGAISTVGGAAGKDEEVDLERLNQLRDWLDGGVPRVSVTDEEDKLASGIGVEMGKVGEEAACEGTMVKEDNKAGCKSGDDSAGRLMVVEGGETLAEWERNQELGRLDERRDWLWRRG